MHKRSVFFLANVTFVHLVLSRLSKGTRDMPALLTLLLNTTTAAARVRSAGCGVRGGAMQRNETKTQNKKKCPSDTALLGRSRSQLWRGSPTRLLAQQVSSIPLVHHIATGKRIRLSAAACSNGHFRCSFKLICRVTLLQRHTDNILALKGFEPFNTGCCDSTLAAAPVRHLDMNLLCSLRFAGNQTQN